jgi:hypothetical protein
LIPLRNTVIGAISLGDRYAILSVSSDSTFCRYETRTIAAVTEAAIEAQLAELVGGRRLFLFVEQGFPAAWQLSSIENINVMEARRGVAVGGESIVIGNWTYTLGVARGPILSRDHVVQLICSLSDAHKEGGMVLPLERANVLARLQTANDRAVSAALTGPFVP